MNLSFAQPHQLHMFGGRGNSILVSVSVSQGGCPGSNAGTVLLFQKGGILPECYELSPPVPMTGSQKAIHVLSCLCDNACKGSLAIICKSRASCPVAGFCLSLKRDVNMIQTNKFACLCLKLLLPMHVLYAD